ncbi:hypothetical protein Mmc1_1579 [Magnetococcus marinus MC-1]|uniref:Glycosyltransferase RgtA/B/C/D-like domain-containing protein n=1 Tax=Magnetococcus marinus (strain ATCC BAA-1437 / JCM 17883 / MC-1) TaxID=156889 RepID=A0L7Z5_MAGMM|nr:hypothetical protein [Magnetococcus marinus]ABK44088.1 hypothetical protein Mmc1_1579 [Magnetococcus marinus MC-1]
MAGNPQPHENLSWGITLLAVLLLALLSVALNLYFWQPPVGSDDLHYFQRAMGALPLTQEPVQHGALRLFLTLLIQLPNLLLGHGYTLEAFYTAIGFQSVLGFCGVALFAFAAAPSRTAALLTLLFWVTSYAALLTQAKLVPDGFGTAIAFFATGLLYGLALRWPVSPTSHLFRLGVMTAGLLLWGAFSIRATFAPFILSALLLGLFSYHRRYLMPYLLLGLLLGSAIELFALWQIFGDPLIRLHTLLGYGTGGIEGTIFAQQDQASLSTGQALWLLALRFPKLLYNTGSAEVFFFLFGGLGTLTWLLRRPGRAPLSKAMLLLLGFGALAFAVKGGDFSRPYLRESLRYYLQCLPLFQLATAELLLLATPWLLNRWHPRIGFKPATLATFAVAMGLIGLNLWTLNQSTHLAKNGNTGQLTILHRLNQLPTPPNPTLYGDGTNLFPLFFPAGSPWQHQKQFTQHSQPGYLLIDWRKRNYMLKLGYAYGKNTHQLYDTIAHSPHLYRHQSGRWLYDLFLVEIPPIQRASTPLPTDGFTLTDAKGEQSPWSQPLQLTQNQSVHASALAIALPGQQLLRLHFRAKTHMTSATLQVMLRYTHADGQTHQQFMGESVADKTWHDFSLWTYLPVAGHSPDLLLKLSHGSAEIQLQALELLERHPLDQLENNQPQWQSTWQP